MGGKKKSDLVLEQSSAVLKKRLRMMRREGIEMAVEGNFIPSNWALPQGRRYRDVRFPLHL